MSVNEDPVFDPPSPEALPAGDDPRLSLMESNTLKGRNEQLERENQLLRQRLRQAEKEVTDLKARAKVKASPSTLADARRRVAGTDANEEGVRRSFDNRDEALLELRRRVESLKMRLGKCAGEPQEEVEETLSLEDKGALMADEDDNWTATTTGTTYDTAEDEDDEEETTGPRASPE